ncbi:uncharacterized protein [Narcine bancroftii]|uniref:uncharacterized protein n=1 Tax=Narcine bancroftii TaxID=1343680 RepID=UPI003831F8C1
MEEKDATTKEKMKRSVYYQLIIINNYQKAIGQEVAQLLEWVRTNIQNIPIFLEDCCKSYEVFHDQLIQLHASSKVLYKILQEIKAGALFQLGMLTSRSEYPKEEVVPNGVTASISKSNLEAIVPTDLTGFKEVRGRCVDEEFTSYDTKLDISRKNISQLNCPHDVSIISTYKMYELQEENPFIKHSEDRCPFTNSQRLGVDKPVEVASSKGNSDLRMTMVEDKLASENTMSTQLQVYKEEPHIFTNKCKSSNGKQIYVARSECEIWDTFEFTASGSNITEESEEGKTCTQIMVSSLSPTSSQELSSKSNALQQSNQLNEISTSKKQVFSPQPYVSPYSSLEPLIDSQFSSSRIESDTELSLIRNIEEFQYCQWQKIEIRVSYVIGPHNFYIQHSGQELPEMMKKLNIECSRSSATKSFIPLINAYVSAWLPENKQWYRGCVIKVEGSEETVTHGIDNYQHITVVVLCVDYGFSASLSLSHLKILPPAFYALPQQALRVSLANVSPVHGATWSKSEIASFKKLVKNKTYFAKVYQKMNVMTVELFSKREKKRTTRRGLRLSQKMAAAPLTRCSKTLPKVRPRIPLHWKQHLKKLLSEAMIR